MSGTSFQVHRIHPVEAIDMLGCDTRVQVIPGDWTESASNRKYILGLDFFFFFLSLFPPCQNAIII